MWRSNWRIWDSCVGQTKFLLMITVTNLAMLAQHKSNDGDDTQIIVDRLKGHGDLKSSRCCRR